MSQHHKDEHIRCPFHRNAVSEVVNPLEGLSVIRWQGSSHAPLLRHKVSSKTLCLCANLEGQTIISASFAENQTPLHAHEATVLGYPKEEWELKLRSSDGFIVVMEISLETLHQLMSVKYDEKKIGSAFVNRENIPEIISFSPALKSEFEQLFQNAIKPPFNALYLRSRALGILSVLLHNALAGPGEACPFIMSREVEMKLFEARRMIQEAPETPPDAADIAIRIDLTKQTLNQGFKYLFGKSLHQYYLDYRMEKSVEMLKSGHYLVKEIAYQIGYQNPSHFITAFKKRYGTTPKQYMKG